VALKVNVTRRINQVNHRFQVRHLSLPQAPHYRLNQHRQMEQKKTASLWHQTASIYKRTITIITPVDRARRPVSQSNTLKMSSSCMILKIGHVALRRCLLELKMNLARRRLALEKLIKSTYIHQK